MYWHPEATARAVADAGLRATIGGPLFDADGKTAGDAGDRAGATSTQLAELRRRRSTPPSPRTRSTRSAKSCCAGPPSSAAEREVPVHIHLSETEQEVEDCVAQHGLRPAAYLDRLGLLERAHGPRPRRLARPGGAGADRRARLHRRHQPGRQHEARGRRRLPLPGGARGRRRGRPRHRRRRLQRLARPARRPQGLRPRPAPRRRRPHRRSPPRRPGRIATGARAPLLGAARSTRRPPTSSCCAHVAELGLGDLTPTSSTRLADRRHHRVAGRC